jgi:hypothetical protein
MNLIVEKAHTAIAKPEVQELMKKLSEHGLGVFMPHMHDPETGDYVPLPKGMVSVEKDLQVSFHSSASKEVTDARAVGWIWDQTTQTAMACTVCYEYRGQHGKSNH